VTRVRFTDNKGGRWGKWEERWDEEERRVGKAKSCLRSEGIEVLGSGNLGVVMWSEMTNSKATACARLTVQKKAEQSYTHPGPFQNS